MCAAGFRFKSVSGREQVSLSSMLSSRPGLPEPVESVRRSLGQLVHSPPKAGVLAAHAPFTAVHMDFVPAIPYIQFLRFVKVMGENAPFT